MSQFEIGFLRKNKLADWNDPDERKPWFRGQIKIDGEMQDVVVFKSGKEGDEYWTMKPDSPRQGSEGRPSPRTSGSKAQREPEPDIPF